jgi:GNAT superfamily N-acetyltransferase
LTALDSARVEGLRGFYRTVASASNGARLVSLGDVQACVVPASRMASIPNGVVYSSSEALAEALPSLPEVYGDLPYLVWVRPGDSEAVAACEAAGLRHDASPAFMGCPLEDIAPPRGTVEPEWADWPAASEINERAYGLPPGAFAGIFGGGTASPPARLYGARLDGRMASVLVTVDAGEHLGYYLVATHPDAQRRGLAAELMRVAAAEARSRGLRTTALEASKAGEPVYAGLGFQRLGTIEQYERRL